MADTEGGCGAGVAARESDVCDLVAAVVNQAHPAFGWLAIFDGFAARDVLVVPVKGEYQVQGHFNRAAELAFQRRDPDSCPSRG